MRPENTEMYLRGARSYSSLTTDEKLRFGLLLGLFLARFDTVLEYRERGMVDDVYVVFHSDAIRIMFEYPGVHEWCETSRQFRGLPARIKEWLAENVNG